MPKKGENIYKRKDGRWEGRYIKFHTPEGKAVYGSVYAKTYREVKHKLSETVALKKNVIEDSDNAKMTSDLFKTVADTWLEMLKPQIKESTLNKYWNLLHSYILPVFGEMRFEQVTQDFIEEQCKVFLQTGGKKQQGLSAKTTSDILSVIRSILAFAHRKGQIIVCNGQDVRIRQTQKEMRIFSREEQEKLCRYLYSQRTPYSMGILICLFTAIRIGELCALTWEDISLSEKTLYIHHTLQRVQDRSGGEKKTKLIVTTPKSVCSIRIIPLPDELVSKLAAYQFSQIGYFLTGTSENVTEPRTMQKYFRKTLQKCEIAPANYHALRHTFATRCIEVGFDIKSLSEILGHASVNITMNRYVHPTMELKKENMKRLAALIPVK